MAAADSGKWFTSFADLQWRQVNYWINGFDNNPSIILFNRYNFINPKAGITYTRGPYRLIFLLPVLPMNPTGMILKPA